MDGTKRSSLSAARAYFEKELIQVIQRRGVETAANSVQYLSELILRYMASEAFFLKAEDGKLRPNVLAELYGESLQGGPREKLFSLQRLGDVSLLMTGFFADSLKRKPVDLDYYMGMGCGAYGQLSQLHFVNDLKSVFRELSIKFKIFSGILEELSDTGGIQSNKDLLSLYEKWLAKRSEHLKEKLSEHGISDPVVVDPKVKH